MPLSGPLDSISRIITAKFSSSSPPSSPVVGPASSLGRPTNLGRADSRGPAFSEAWADARAVSLGLCLVASLFSSPAEAQTAKGKGPKNAPGAAIDLPGEKELPSLGFTLPNETDLVEVDPDETPAGQQRLGEVTSRAKAIYAERDEVERERRPLAIKRDVIVEEIKQLLGVMENAAAMKANAAKQIAQIQTQKKLATDEKKRNLDNQESQLRQTIANADIVIRTNQGAIAERQAPLNALNIAIAPFDARLLKLWNELNECRKQWLEVRVPQHKYARTDFESLKRVLDDWLVIDGLWPEAQCWGALCSCELDDFERAASQIEKAEKIRTEVMHSKRAWPAVEAMKALVVLHAPGKGQRTKSEAALKKAMQVLDKDTDWETLYIASRVYLEGNYQPLKSKSYLERALKINPNSKPCRFQLASLQTTSADPKIRNVDAGLRELESLWTKTGKKQWRLGRALAKAYAAAENPDDADRQWTATIAIAPPSLQRTLEAERRDSK